MQGSVKGGTVDILSMSLEEIEAWMDEEPEPIPLKLFPLCTNEGRKAFLDEYISWGNDRLFEAVAHIWSQLNEPKQARCIGIGLAAGTGGTGKWALATFLKGALRVTLDNPVPMPRGCDYEDIHAFHEAWMRRLADDRQRYDNLIQQYADYLDGRPGRHQPRQLGKVLTGPWQSAPAANDHAIAHRVRS